MRGFDEAAAQLDTEWSSKMAAAQGGDKAAYEHLLRSCAPFIRRIVRRQGVPPDRVDDVTQDVLLTVHRARHTYDPSRSFTAWLRTVAQRRAIDHLRSRSRLERWEVFSPADYDTHPDPTADASLAGSAPERERSIAAAVQELSPGQREAVEALAIRQLSLAEASSLTGKTKGALKVNLHRALNTLRARFGGDP